MKRARIDKAQDARDEDQTRGDLSNAAARGEGTGDLTVIDTQQPQGWRQDHKANLIGDLTVKLNPEGKVEEVLSPIQNPIDAFRAYRLSPFLGSIVEAFVINVYGSEYTFKPRLDLDDPKTPKRVKAALEYEKAKGDFDAEVEVTDTEVQDEIDRIRRRMGREKEYLQAWFENACPDMSYYALCVLNGQDKGITGTAYWEVMRDITGKPKRLMWTPAWSVRAKPQGKEFVAVKRAARVTSIRWGEDTVLRRFRSYVQIDSSGSVVGRFKEFGDPRVLSRKSGKYYPTIEAMRSAEVEEHEDADGNRFPVYPLPATELLDFRTYYAGNSAYGKPKWTPYYPDLVGMRDLAEENQLTVTDQAIPNMMIFVAGGRMSEADVIRMEEKIESRKPGEKKVMILQAYNQRNPAAGPSTAPSVHVEKTKDVQNTDILGLNYIKTGERGLRRAYRIPKVSLGDDEGVNRATMFGAFRFTEDQVYDPERFEFKDRINTTLIPSLGVQYYTYEPLSRAPRDPELLSTIVERLARVGALTPEESREIAEEILNRDFKDIDAIWNRMPVTILNAILQTKNKVTAAAIMAGSDDEETDDADLLQTLRAALVSEFEQNGLLRQQSQRSMTDDEDADDTDPEGGSKPSDPAT